MARFACGRLGGSAEARDRIYLLVLSFSGFDRIRK
jgi:hypothetical protein